MYSTVWLYNTGSYSASLDQIATYYGQNWKNNRADISKTCQKEILQVVNVIIENALPLSMHLVWEEVAEQLFSGELELLPHRFHHKSRRIHNNILKQAKDCSKQNNKILPKRQIDSSRAVERVKNLKNFAWFMEPSDSSKKLSFPFKCFISLKRFIIKLRL